MNAKILIASLITLLAGILLALILFRRRPRKLKTNTFVGRWRELQAYCRHKSTWPNALEEADKLLDLALKKHKFKGKRMGVRMVAAQKSFTDNDSVWSAHNLTKRVVVAGDKIDLNKQDVMKALVSYRQALGDLGALPRVDKK